MSILNFSIEKLQLIEKSDFTDVSKNVFEFQLLTFIETLYLILQVSAGRTFNGSTRVSVSDSIVEFPLDSDSGGIGVSLACSMRSTFSLSLTLSMRNLVGYAVQQCHPSVHFFPIRPFLPPRSNFEEDKAQVIRYKQLLLKQRDIMTNA